VIAAEAVRTLGVVGTGALGSGWVALGLARRLRVVAWDPADGAEERLRTTVGRLLEDQGPVEGRVDGLVFAASLAEVAEQADLVLEAGPETLEAKREIFAGLDAYAPADVVLASSSSGLMPSQFQDAAVRHPERVLVTHPFNPPHLMPLVEVVGGELTSEEAAEAASATLRLWGKTPIRIRRELPGHVANRLQAALWREAYHLVEQGVVSVADLDTAVASGPGLRWSLLGPLATQHLSGGPGGLAYALEHLGPPMVAWWKTLGEPDLTPELVDRLVTGVSEELAGEDHDALAVRRDRALRRLLRLKDELDL